MSRTNGEQIGGQASKVSLLFMKVTYYLPPRLVTVTFKAVHLYIQIVLLYEY